MVQHEYFCKTGELFIVNRYKHTLSIIFVSLKCTNVLSLLSKVVSLVMRQLICASFKTTAI